MPGSNFPLPSLGFMPVPSSNSLPQILPHFAVPQLEDKPQNPILDNEKLYVEYPLLNAPTIFVKNISHSSNRRGRRPPWSDAITKDPRGNRSQVVSWDSLSRRRSSGTATPLLSEQHDATFAAVRYHTMPPLDHSQPDTIHVLFEEFFQSLRMTLLGTSSVLYSWDTVSENFTHPCRNGEPNHFIAIVGKDQILSQSFTKRFLVIGTLLRRLETLVTSLRSRPARDGPTVHAFAHSLSAVLTFLREEMAQWPGGGNNGVDSHMSSATWVHFEEFEDILTALSVLCGREARRSPSDYVLLDSSPSSLLSSVYDHLHMHIERRSTRTTISIFAFILTGASREYIRNVCQSVGLGKGASYHGSQPIRNNSDIPIPGARDEFYDENNQPDLFGYQEEIEDTYPVFFFPDLVDSVTTARRSLPILRIAHPDHPFLKRYPADCNVKWVWTESEIQALWDVRQGDLDVTSSHVSSLESPDVHSALSQNTYGPGLASFHVFDCEPGSHFHSSFLTNNSPAFQTRALRSFMTSFPESLSPITPTLGDLASLAFSPLLDHTAQLSKNLLLIFLSPSSDLNFQTHLVLLRSYLLLTSHSFRSRLTAALFSDSADCVDKSTMKRVLHLPDPMAIPRSNRTRPWAVGLAPSLTDRETWPPGGGDLSFLLRTVIVDSLELGRSKWDHENSTNKVSQSARNRILSEAESRLAFAIRDLPLGPGVSQWLNPLSIEALDFLYLDYKPPDPLGVLISPEILSRYQRVFAFMLRMLRAESVLHAVYRMTCKDSTLFPTLTSSNKLLLHFRFVLHSFVTSLTGYIVDTAIRGNFDVFLMRLSQDNPGFSDVFSLAKAHATVMDNILYACLLRSGQRSVGDVLRGALDIVLDFGILAGELYEGSVEEYQAASLLESQFQKFCVKMKTLTKVLKVLAEKEDAQCASAQGVDVKPLQVSKTLYHLLIRLDLGDWWSKASV